MHCLTSACRLYTLVPYIQTIFTFLHLQVSGSEAVWISVGLFVFSVLTSTPFVVITKLKKMFDEPGEFDYIAFCVEDLPQLGQVKTHLKIKIRFIL